jgi:hypothetical protein
MLGAAGRKNRNGEVRVIALWGSPTPTFEESLRGFSIIMQNNVPGGFCFIPALL